MIHLKELRRKKAISLKELGDAMGVSESTISLYENQKREAPYYMLIKIANFFDVSTDYLLGLKNNEEFNIDNIPVLESVTLENGNYTLNFSNKETSKDINQFLFKMHDNSMESQISQGDYAVINANVEIKNSDLAVVILDNSPITVRKIYFKDDAILLNPFNPKFDSTFIDEKSKLIILGKVIYNVKKW